MIVLFTIAIIYFDHPDGITNYINNFKINDAYIFSIIVVSALIVFNIFNIKAAKYIEYKIDYIANKFTPNDNNKFNKTEAMSKWAGTGYCYTLSEKQGFSRTFHSRDEVLTFLKQTSDDWTDLKEIALKSELWIVYCDRLRDLFNDARLDLLDDKYEALNRIGHLIERNLILLKDGALGSYIFDRNNAPEKRYYAMCFLTEMPIFDIISADTDYGLSPDGALTKDFVRQYPDFSPEIGGNRVVMDLAMSAIRQANSLRVQANEISQLKDNLVQTLQEAETTLALRPAAQKWRNSARWSALLAFIGLLPFLMIIGGAFWYATDIKDFFVYLVTAPEGKSAPLANYAAMLEKAPWSTVIFISLPAILLAWVLKHFSRMFVQNFNLANDARTRSALAQVYTDLSSPGTLSEKQKEMIFEAMFKPREVSHNDEGIPYTPLENAGKILGADKPK